MFVATIISYSTEIRVYSWAILFVTLAYIYFLEIIKDNKKISWNMFIICCSISFWFHKIAVIPLGFLYVYLFEQQSKDGFKKLEYYINNNLKTETFIFKFDYGKYILDYYQFNGLKNCTLIWDSEFIENSDSLYLIYTYKLDEYFDGKDFQVIKEFNISHDLFSLCKLNIQ
ncbi:MAG: hypothetical protein QM266_06030 [Bacillota bacterium]|nr:hypothetical protein [Bacillota bacterium]